MSESVNDTRQWCSRSSIPAIELNQSVVFGGDPADKLVPVTINELSTLRTISQASWSLANIKASDRVLVSTIQEGGFPVATGAEVIAPLCKAVSYAHPRGRLRLLQTIKAFKPTVWVTTPCAALDFLARLYMEFNIDPFELGIEHIVLTGEVASKGAHKRLADEFESTITDLYCDPVFGAALAVRSQGKTQYGESGILSLASLTENKVLSNSLELPSDTDENTEIIVNFNNIEALNNITLRTGHVVAANQPANLFHHTIGDHVLARGRWLSLPLFTKVLKLIDGAQGWQLMVERGEGTLDRVTLKMGLNRDSLVSNPMWQARIREAIVSVTPLTVNVDCFLLTADDPQLDSLVDDQRGHHLGDGSGLKASGGWPL